MTYAFNLDQILPRKGTASSKWEYYNSEDKGMIPVEELNHGHEEIPLLPLWIADMDFRVPEEVIEAIKTRADHGIFGYNTAPDEYYDAIISWLDRRTGWKTKKEWFLITPGVVTGLNLAVQTYTNPGDKVLIQRPVYHPFTNAIENNGREVVSNSLIYQNGRYDMDFEDLAQKAADPAVKLAFLCSPHNPVGRVWTAEELREFGKICLENDVLVVADEIHCDLIFSHNEFVSFVPVHPDFAQNTIACRAASKTFNLAGLKTSSIIIPNPRLREQLDQRLEQLWLRGITTFGLVATTAAYQHGEPWLETVMRYIEENYAFMKAFFKDHLPGIKVVEAGGTYLIWLDCSGLGIPPRERHDLILNRARVYLNNGQKFGPEGAQFERINIACPRPLLKEALVRIKQAVDEYKRPNLNGHANVSG